MSSLPKTLDVVLEQRSSSSSSDESGTEIKERGFSGSGSSVEVDLESGDLTKDEKDCRICHLSLDATNQESGVPIELGCSCKEDLAAAHKHCAEAWFKIKGNKLMSESMETPEYLAELFGGVLSFLADDDDHGQNYEDLMRDIEAFVSPSRTTISLSELEPGVPPPYNFIEDGAMWSPGATSVSHPANQVNVDGAELVPTMEEVKTEEELFDYDQYYQPLPLNIFLQKFSQL